MLSNVIHVTGKDVEQCEKYLNRNGHGFNISDDVRESKLGATQKLVLELIREKPLCTQKYIVDTIVKDQGQVEKAIDRLVEVGLVSKKNFTLLAL
jgi:DNA-binding MarR family transcriptional regulator